MRIALGLGMSAGFGLSWTPAALSSLRSWYKGNAMHTDIQGNNTLTVNNGPLSTGTLNGHTTSIFNGTNQYLNDASFGLGAGGDISIFGVVKVTSNNGTPRQPWAYTDGAFDVTMLEVVSGVPQLNNGVGTSAGSTNLVGVWKRLGITNITGANNQKLYVNGTQEAQQSGTAVANNLLLQVGAYSAFLAFEMAELVVCNEVLSGGDRALLDAYFAARYAI